MKFEISEEPLPEPQPPADGWKEPWCDFSDHQWVMEVNDGRVGISCMDPCDESLYDPSGGLPCCLVEWNPEDFHTPEAIKVELTYVDDSSPAGPWGPAEYGYYIEVAAKQEDR